MKKIILVVMLLAITVCSTPTNANDTRTIDKLQEYRYITHSNGNKVYFTRTAESVDGAFIIKKGTIATVSEVREWLGYNDYNILLRIENVTDEYGNAYDNIYQWFRQVDVEIYLK